MSQNIDRMRGWSFRLLPMMGCAVMVALLSGCTHHPTDAEKRTVSELTTSMQTQGLGRYLIDLPPTWRFGSGDVTLYYGLGTDFKTVEVTVIDQGVTPTQFQAAVAWRAKRIQDISNNKTYRSMLAGTWPVDVRVDDGKGDQNREAVLLRYYDDTTLDIGFDHELHLLLGSTYVQLSAKSYEGLDPSTEATAQVDSRLKTLARQIFLVTDPARTGPGFILGPIVIDGPQDHEQATLKFYDPQRRDVTLEIDSSAVTPDESPHLLNRIDRDITASGTPIHVLRRGKHDFAGMAGEEALGSMKEEVDSDKGYVHSILFAGETYRTDPGLLRPSLALRLTAGGNVSWMSDAERATRRAAPDYLMNPRRLPNIIVVYNDPADAAPSPPPVEASLTDHEAIAVWDAILPTIRPRPGAVAPPKPKEPLPPSSISREQAERDRQTLDAFIASGPGNEPEH